MPSDDGAFWDQRYRSEGAIWGESPSPTALLAARHLVPGANVLDIGFGYGRDLLFLGQLGCKVYGIDLSSEGHSRALENLARSGLRPERLLTGRFEDGFAGGPFDAALSHRMAHLLLTRLAIVSFAARASALLRAGGLLCIGARNPDDLAKGMVAVEDGVWEYADRPGHRVRYWDDDTFRQAFAEDFTILSLTRATEPESASRPIACHLTVMLARKRENH